MSSDSLIVAEEVGKVFCKNLKRSLYYGLVDSYRDLLPWSTASEKTDRALRKGEFWANRGISFELRRGECLGLIGHNGAGKTTLLKILNSLIVPDAGQVTLRGKIGALIALGAGFNPILSGRENIFISGSVIGLSRREIESKFDEIVDFSGLEDFIDSPLQNYSSGMQVRLGFSVAAILLKPDILLLDEVLAVGDTAFRSKCYTRIGKLIESAAVILVSHSMTQVAHLCDKVLVLNHGEVAYCGDLEGGIDVYECEGRKQKLDQGQFLNLEPPFTKFDLRIPTETISSSDPLDLHISVETSEIFLNSWLRIVIYDKPGSILGEWDNRLEEIDISFRKGASSIQISLEPIHLKPGDYYLGIQLSDKRGMIQYIWSYKNSSFIVAGATKGHGHMHVRTRRYSSQ